MDVEPPAADRTIVDCLQKTVDGVVAVYRFGSTVYGVPNAESDTDVAVLARSTVRMDAWFAAVEQLSAALQCEVDLLDLRLASPVLALQAITRGRMLLDAHATVRLEFEGRVLGEYARLNEQRRGVLERIAREGTVYGR